uniref:PDZ domain-containing protein n=1 Tax=Loa loa TaxID=7209 RepID=A0A1I7VJZ3_LOALO
MDGGIDRSWGTHIQTHIQTHVHTHAHTHIRMQTDNYRHEKRRESIEHASDVQTFDVLSGECVTITSLSDRMADAKTGIERGSMKTGFKREDDSEKSISSNEDFESSCSNVQGNVYSIGDAIKYGQPSTSWKTIQFQLLFSIDTPTGWLIDGRKVKIIGSQTRIFGHSASGDEKSNDPFIDLFKKHVVKRRVPILSYGLQQKRAMESAILTCGSEINNKEENTFDENEHGNETLAETVAKQQQIIEKLKNQLKSCASLNVHTLPIRIEEERATAFERKDGFNYFFVVVDWKRNNEGIARQHLHLAFKQSNSSIYVYDHGPLSGRYFTVGDRIIDIDGIAFVRAADLRDQILWSHHNKDHFTSIIERPATEQAARIVSTLLQPSVSSFSVVLSV